MSEEALRIDDVEDVTTYSRATIWRKVAKGEFPPPRKPGPQIALWLRSEVEEHLRNLPVREGDSERSRRLTEASLVARKAKAEAEQGAR